MGEHGLALIREPVIFARRALLGFLPLVSQQAVFGQFLGERHQIEDAVAQAAYSAGSKTFGGQVVFLKSCSWQVFLPFLEHNFPLLVRRYRERFQRSAYLRGDYPERIAERIARIRRRYGFEQRFHQQEEPELWPHDPQLLLFESTRLFESDKSLQPR